MDMKQLKMVERPISGLKGYDKNPRKNDAQVDRMVESIGQFGFRIPVVAKSDGSVVDGHLRLKAAQRMGMKSVPVVLADELTDAQVKAFRLLANRSANWADWDDDLLRQELADLKGMDFDLSLTGFDTDEISSMLDIPLDVGGLTDPDEVPEPPVVPVTKPGDVWRLGKHRLMCGDSTSIDAVEKLMQGEKADMVFTDPPYGIGFDKQEQKIGKSKSYGAVLNDHSPEVAIDAFNLSQSFCDGHFFFWGANHYANALPGSPCWLVWDKQGGKHVTFADVELCYTSIDAPARMFTHIWDGFRRDSEKGESRVHPTQKPVQLIMDIWKYFEKHISEATTVLDLFGGSGSTLIACEKTGRAARLMELDPKYCDVIVKRWEDFTGKKAVLETNSAGCSAGHN